jgi:hypothetical protein
MDENESRFGGFWIKTMLEGSDETEIVVLKAALRVFQTIVEEGVRACVLHEWLEAGTNSSELLLDEYGMDCLQLSASGDWQ